MLPLCLTLLIFYKHIVGGSLVHAFWKASGLFHLQLPKARGESLRAWDLKQLAYGKGSAPSSHVSANWCHTYPFMKSWTKGIKAVKPKLGWLCSYGAHHQRRQAAASQACRPRAEAPPARGCHAGRGRRRRYY